MSGSLATLMYGNKTESSKPHVDNSGYVHGMIEMTPHDKVKGN